MESQRQSELGGHEAEGVAPQGYLRAAAYDDSEGSLDSYRSVEEDSQAWGDYLEEIEGYEI